MENVWAKMRDFDSRHGFELAGRQVKGRVFHCDSVMGSDSNNGIFSGLGDEMANGHAWLTIEHALAQMDHYDALVLSGVFKEQLTAPLIYDITFIGAGNRPRQATNGGVHTGGGATWLKPDTPVAATPLLKVYTQGWRFANIFMAADTDAACIQLERRETAAIPDSSHAEFDNIVFGGGLYGIEAIEVGFVEVLNSKFRGFTGTNAYAIKGTAGDGIALPLEWDIINNRFRDNKNHVKLSLSSGRVKYNDFGIVGASVTTVIALDLSNGGNGKNNTVSQNQFNRPLNTSPNATLYVGGTNDVWYENYGTDGVFYGVPDNA